MQTSPNPRALAATVIDEVLAGRSLTEALDDVWRSNPQLPHRPLVQEYGFGVMRFHPRLAALASRLLLRPLKAKDQDIHALILIGLYQLIYMNIPTHAAVAETVQAARALKKPWAANLVNAVLRGFQRDGASLLAEVDQNPMARFACPSWLLQAVEQAWPRQWQSILEASNQRPLMALRVNRARISRDDYCRRLDEAGIGHRPCAHAPEGVVLERPIGVDVLPGFADGYVSVQDCGAQLAAHLLEPAPGQRILDACAAPGGKTCHLLELVGGEAEMVAVDQSEVRLRRVEQNLRRTGLDARLVVADAVKPEGDWARDGLYDRILLDAPCSATGVIRRHPDIKHLRRSEDISTLVSTQSAMLDALWPLLRPGGILLYATCSLLPRENAEQVEAFLARQPQARERTIRADWGEVRIVGRQTLPLASGSDMDGFYYARIEKLS